MREMGTIHFLLILTTLIFIFSNPSTTLACKAKTSSISKPPHRSSTFILKVCNSTRFPRLCHESLNPFASSIKDNHLKLCKTSLSLTLNATRRAYITISKLQKQTKLGHKEAQVVNDCIDNLKNAVYELRKSVSSMGELGRKDRDFQLNNIQTWVSAALTDEDTCLEGFKEQKVSLKVKNKIRISVIKVVRMTSNTLAFINDLKE